MATRIEFAREVLTLGKFSHHLNTYVTLICWMAGEGTLAKNNPLATTRPAPKATNFNSTTVKNYPTLAAGVKATVDTLNNGNYPAILKSLKAADIAVTTLNHVQDSPWGTKFDALGSFIENVRADWSKYAFININA